MTLKALKNILLVGFVCTVASPVLAEDGSYSGDSAYDNAYEECNQMAENNGDDDNWQNIFDSCMKSKGFESHEDGYEQENSHEGEAEE
jgi:hypothetical protein